MRRVPPGVAIAALLAAACSTSAHSLFQEDALALIQSTALGGGAQRHASAVFGPLQAAFKAGQEVEVNVFGSKWVNATIVGPGTKSDTYRIHVPSFPSGHQDLPDVKVATLRDPKAEERRLALRAQETARRKADEEARRKAEEAEKRAAEAEQSRVADLLAHTFEPGELVEVKSTSKSGNLTWIKATIVGKGTQPNKYNISVGGTKIGNINYLALRKDAAYHFEAGEHAEVRAKSGNLKWVKCIITGKGDKPSTYNINIPAAPKNKQDLLNIPATSLRKEPIPVWTPQFELGYLMEVSIPSGQNKSNWVKCNVTGTAVKVETYHLQVLTNATGYRLENVSALHLRETQEGKHLLKEKHERERALAEANRKAEKERLRKEEEAAVRKRYAMRKLEEAEEEKKLLEDLQKAEEEKAKTDPLTFLKLRAQKKMDHLVQLKKEQRLKMERELQRKEQLQKEVMETMTLRAKQHLESKAKAQKEQVASSEDVGRTEEEDVQSQRNIWEKYAEADRQRRKEAEQRAVEFFARSKQEEESQEDMEARRAQMMEARRNAEKEKLRRKQQDERLKKRGEARKELKRALLAHGERTIIAQLRPAIEEANRTGMELEALVEPSRTLIWALWNTTVAKLRQVVPRHNIMELEKVLLESQATGLEMARLQKFVELGEAKQRGEKVDEASIPGSDVAAAASAAARGVPSSLTRASAEEALSRDYSAPQLKGVPEYVEAERFLRYEAGKWAAYLHMKDAERAKDAADLRRALGEAEAANVTEALVREGRVIANLLEASSAEDVSLLHMAIAEAQDFENFCNRSNFVSNDTVAPLAAARRVLEAEAAREPARLELRSAAAARDVGQLETALRHGETAKLKRQELEEGRQVRDQIIREKKSEREQQRLEEAKQRKAEKEIQRLARAELKAKTRIDEKRKAKDVAERKALDVAERKSREAKEGSDTLERKRREAEEFRERKAREVEERRQREQEALQRAKEKEAAKLKAKEDAAEARKMRLEAKVRAKEERERKAQEEAMRREREKAERKELAEAERMAELERERERKEREEQERRAKEEAARVEQERKAEEEEKMRLQSAAEWKAKEDAMAKSQQEAARLERIEARIGAKEDVDEKVKEPEVRQAKEAERHGEEELKAKDVEHKESEKQESKTQKQEAQKASEPEKQEAKEAERHGEEELKAKDVEHKESEKQESKTQKQEAQKASEPEKQEAKEAERHEELKVQEVEHRAREEQEGKAQDQEAQKAAEPEDQEEVS